MLTFRVLDNGHTNVDLGHWMVIIIIVDRQAASISCRFERISSVHELIMLVSLESESDVDIVTGHARVHFEKLDEREGWRFLLVLLVGINR